jgi:hypothetical protein
LSPGLFGEGLSALAYLWLLALLEESLLCLLLLALLLSEVVGCGDLLEGLRIDSREVDTGAGGDHVASVHPSEGNTVDLEGSSDQEDTLGQVLEQDDALAPETTSEEDQDSTGLEAFPGLSRVNGLADLLRNKLLVTPIRVISVSASLPAK